MPYETQHVLNSVISVCTYMYTCTVVISILNRVFIYTCIVVITTCIVFVLYIHDIPNTVFIYTCIVVITTCKVFVLYIHDVLNRDRFNCY